MAKKFRGPVYAGSKPMGKPNKLESDYMHHLEELKRTGKILDWWFERITFTLSFSRENVVSQKYTPDFAVILPSGELEFHETKGYQHEKGMNKLKVAGDMFPFTFRLVTRGEDGGWNIEKH